jgi:hypothetical protein
VLAGKFFGRRQTLFDLRLAGVVEVQCIGVAREFACSLGDSDCRLIQKRQD